MIGCIVVKNMTRPSLNIDVVYDEKSDFSIKDLEIKGKLEKQFWTAVTFEVDVDPYDICGKYTSLTLKVSEIEAYNFKDAMVSILPGAKIGSGPYVVVYEKCETSKISKN